MACRRSRWMCMSTASSIAGAMSRRGRRSEPPKRSRPSCLGATGSKSTSGWCRSANSSARGCSRNARPACCCRCAGRSASVVTAESRRQRGASLLPESVERHHLAGLLRLLLLGGFGRCGFDDGVRLAGGLELQPELDGGIGKGRDRIEGNGETLALVLETQSDGEAVLANLEIPELVLEHHRHLLRILLRQIVGEDEAGEARAEGDVEMMRAGEALCSGAG